jgi:hypothetical protein
MLTNDLGEGYTTPYKNINDLGLTNDLSALTGGRRWRGAGSSSELLDAEATQTLHSRVGSCRRMVRAL